MASRYQVRTLHTQQGDVTTYEGIDPLTGLPVLIYQFRGRAAAGLRDLESENIPGLLEIEVTGNDTQVVVAYFKDYQPVSTPPDIPVATLLLDSARALSDAAEAGVIHGDIRPERFLASRDHVLLEGFGVPWLPESSYQPPEGTVSFAGDVYALSKSLLELAAGNLSEGATAALNAGVTKRAGERLSAAELYSALQHPTPAAQATTQAASTQPDEPNETAQAQSFADEKLTFGTSPGGTPAERTTSDTPPADADPDFSVAFEDETVETDFGNAFSDEPRESVSPGSVRGEAEPSDPLEEPVIPLDKTDPAIFLSEVEGRPVRSGDVEGNSAGNKVNNPEEPPTLPPTAVASRVPPEAEQSGERFVKDLPPGATYRPGDVSATQMRPGLVEEYSFDEEPERAQATRRLLLLGLLLVLVVVLASLALFWQRRGSGAAVTPTQTTETVDATLVSIEVLPEDLPPVDLYVVNSPEGSRTPPGSILTRLNPGFNDVTLDQEGVWQFQARFQDRVSDVATLTLPAPPGERSITLDVPPAPDEQEP